MNSIISSFFRKSANQSLVKSIIQTYRDKYPCLCDKYWFERHVLYELVSRIQESHYTDIAKFLEAELDQPSLLFDDPIFNDTRQRLSEEMEFMDNPTEIEDGVVECGRCKSLKTVSYSKQTRASDEGASVFVTCVTCGYKFKL